MQLLNADHFNVSKFRSPSDPNYHIIKNSLAKAVETILGDGESFLVANEM